MRGSVTKWLRISSLAIMTAAVPVLGETEPQLSDPSVIAVGHWLEVRGEVTGNGRLLAAKAALMEPQRYEVLIGTVTGRIRGEEFTVLGQPVRLSEKTEWEGIARMDAPGARVKVEGHYRRIDKFSAREISPRGPGRERISGRVDAIRRTRFGYEAQVMRWAVELPSDIEVEHQGPWQELPLAPADPERTFALERGEDEDDLFGDGYPLTRDLRLSAQFEVRSTSEENFDLDDEDAEDRVDDETSIRVRVEWEPGPRVSAQLEGRFQARYRDDEEDGTSTEDSGRLGETFVYLHDPLGNGFDLAVGRQDFDDPREWVYDQNLDGVRVFGALGRVRTEFSVTTSLSDADERDESAVNYIAYLSNRDEDRHVAGYVVHREFDWIEVETTTHIGVRMLGSWFEQQESWFELGAMEGQLLEGDTKGWALDVGTTWTPDFAMPYSFTIGYAFGSGDRNSDRSGGTYRQTGLQDNNAKFDGVTSFRYYGELVDPELANLHILTAGFGTRFARKTSLDLVGHYYRQARVRPRIVDSELDDRPNGEDPELGWEIDAVFGWRGRPNMDLEVVGAYFLPGDAFPEVDNALLAKVQLRYRM